MNELHDKIAAERSIIFTACRNWAMIYNLSNPDDIAQDLTQGTMVRAMTKSHTFQPGRNIRKWLYTIAYSVVMDHLRDGMRRPMHLLDDLTVANKENPLQAVIPKSNEQDPEQSLLLREATQIALAQGKTGHAQLMILAYIDEVSIDELAESQNIKPVSIRVRLFRIRNHCKKNLQEAGYFSVTA